jgi:DNA (cytosine-5)-methyltransferase 1
LSGARSGAFWPFWRLVTQLVDEGRKPKAIVLENVCGLLTSHGGADFHALCEHVAQAGYWIGGIVADARDFLPQSRPRFFLIALDVRLQVPGRIQNAYAVDHWHPARLRESQALLPEELRAGWLWFSPPVPPQSNMTLADIIEDEPEGTAWHHPDETRRLLAMMSPVNRAKVELVAANTARAVGAMYKRTRIENGVRRQRAEIRFDIAGCLRTPGGGSSRQQILVSQNRQVRTRLISPRETARLMGLAEDYILPERYNDAYHLTGDGVAVPVVRHIRETILEPFLKSNARMKASA